MKITTYSIAELRNASTLRAVADETELVSASSIAVEVDNPRAEAGDVILLTAKHEGRVVGVLGVIPDRIFIGAASHRIGWMHNWNATGGKGEGAGALLFLAAARHYKDRVAVSGCTPIAEKIYLASRKLVPLQTRAGASFFFRTDLRRRVPARVPARLGQPAARIADKVFDAAVRARMKVWALRAGPSPRASITDHVDPEAARFIETLGAAELFRRGARELDWMRRFTGSASEARSAAGSEPREHLFLRVHDAPGRLLAFVHLGIQRETMKVPFVFAKPTDLEVAARAIVAECAKRPIRDLSVYNPELVAAVDRLGPPAYARKPRSKLFLVAKSLAPELDLTSPHVQDGDGDAFI